MKAAKKRFKRVSVGLLLVPITLCSQTYKEVKNRFDNYLNYGGLERQVEINPEKITFYNFSTGKKEIDFVLPKELWKNVAGSVRSISSDSAEILYRKIRANQDIPLSYAEPVKEKKADKPLSGIKICLDPGHIAGNLDMAYLEQKYVHFTKDIYTDLKTDSVDIAEGVLTFQTSGILKKLLEEKGATVFVTRKHNSTTFGCTYDEWYKKYRKKALDSLFHAEKLTAQKHKLFLHMSAPAFFLEFFKDYELQQRAKVINNFKPDLTVIIHYNVNEKNVPWLKPSDKNFCMAFIPGCITNENIQSPAGRINLLRLLLTNDIDESEKISARVVNELSKQLNIPVAATDDASYLKEHCMATPSSGVYCRNLALCRMVQSPLVYGECLYQDNEKECYELVKNGENVCGVQTNKRVVLAAQSFFNAILLYYSK